VHSIVTDHLVDLVRARCEADSWSVRVKECLAGIQASDDAMRCALLLTDVQLTALADDAGVSCTPPLPAALREALSTPEPRGTACRWNIRPRPATRP
jgi:hypothetical protein